MRTLEELRVEIDRIDQQMVQLFEERMQVVAKVMAVKKAAGLPILDASRRRRWWQRTPPGSVIPPWQATMSG